MVKFNLLNVKNTETGASAKVFYSVNNRRDGRDCVTIYEKSYKGELRKVFPDLYQNNSDGMADYFEKDKVVLFSDNPHYPAALEAVARLEEKRNRK